MSEYVTPNGTCKTYEQKYAECVGVYVS